MHPIAFNTFVITLNKNNYILLKINKLSKRCAVSETSIVVIPMHCKYVVPLKPRLLNYTISMHYCDLMFVVYIPHLSAQVVYAIEAMLHMEIEPGPLSEKTDVKTPH